MNKIIFLLLLTFSIPSFAQSASNLSDIDQWLKPVQDELSVSHSVDQIYITGGSARSLLDFTFDRVKTITFRDLDVIVPMEKEVTRPLAQAIGQALEDRGVGTFLEKDLRPRPRVKSDNPTLDYNAGFGFFVKIRNGEILDLILFHSYSDLFLNGILNIDRIFISLPKEKSLSSVLDNIKSLGYPKSVEQKIVIDPFFGYKSWISKKPKLVNVWSLKKDPLNVSIRIVRALSKIDALPLDNSLTKEIHKALLEMKEFNYFQGLRNILKLLSDKNWAAELKELARLGVLAKFSPTFERKINSHSSSELAAERAEITLSDDLVLNWLLNQFLHIPKTEIIPLLKSLYKIDPESMLKLIGQYNKVNPNQILKIAFFTGEFAPFHNGHLSVAQLGIEKGGLDFLFIIPTPHATNNPKTLIFNPDEWKERLAFANAAIDDENQMAVFPNTQLIDFDDTKTLRLGTVISQLESIINSSSPLVHLAGGDSLFRIISRNLPANNPRRRIIVSRYGVPTPLSEQELKDQQIEIIEGLQRPVSATMILHQLAAGLEPFDLNPKVLKLVKETQRYTSIIKRLRQKRDKLLKVDIEKSMPSKVVVYPFLNYGGLYRDRAEAPPLELADVLMDLNRNGYEIQIFLPEGTFSSVENLWKKFVDPLRLSNVKVIREEPSVSSKDQYIQLIHSGMGNSYFESGRLLDTLNSGQRVMIYETKDILISPLLLDIPGITLFQLNTDAQKNSCSTMFL